MFSLPADLVLPYLEKTLYLWFFFSFCANVAFCTNYVGPTMSTPISVLFHQHLLWLSLLWNYHCIRDLSITTGKLMFVTLSLPPPVSFFFIAFITMCHPCSQHQLEHKLRERKFVFFPPITKPEQCPACSWCSVFDWIISSFPCQQVSFQLCIFRFLLFLIYETCCLNSIFFLLYCLILSLLSSFINSFSL